MSNLLKDCPLPDENSKLIIRLDDFEGQQQQQQQQQNVDAIELLQDHILERCTGDLGRWQIVWSCILSLIQCTGTYHIFIFVFHTIEKDFWCTRPQHLGDISISDWRNLTHTTDGCSLLNIDYENVTNLFDHVHNLPKPWNYTQCTAFEFANKESTSDPEAYANNSRTIIEEFGLVCQWSHMVSVVEMCFLVGAAFGSVSSGWLSDRFGRKHTLMIFVLVQCLFGTLLSFSTSLAMYMALRVIIGFASMTVVVVSFVLVVELVSGKWRTIIGILCLLPVALTYIMAAGIAYYIRDWRTLQLAITCPWFLFITMWYCVPESPRWLLARGKLTELYAIVERAARMNGITLPINYKKSLEAVATSPESVQRAKSEETLNNPLVVVFGKSYWRSTCLILIVWLTLIIIYFGLTLHISNLGGNIYVNTAIVGAVEAISIFASIFVVLKLGIRRNLIAFMLISGLCCLGTNLVPKGDEYRIYVIGLAMIAKCVIGANNAIIPTFTAMQYPTVVRNFGVGLSNLAAGVALILVPYMWLLEHIDHLLPMSIMGMCGIIGSTALILMKDVEY